MKLLVVILLLVSAGFGYQYFSLQKSVEAKEEAIVGLQKQLDEANRNLATTTSQLTEAKKRLAAQNGTSAVASPSSSPDAKNWIQQRLDERKNSLDAPHDNKRALATPATKGLR